MAGPTIKTSTDPGWKRAPLRFGAQQIGWSNYFFLLICAASQLVTFLIAWPAWQTRPLLGEVMPNLPWIAGTPQFSTGILLIASLGLALLSPRKLGMLIHLIVIGVAIAMDQLRCQPQVYSVAFMMAACVWPRARRLCAWYLIAMWTWAGIHKFLSPDWFGFVSCYMLTDAQAQLARLGINTGFDPTRYFKFFAALIALFEVTTGLLAWLRPRLGAIACVLLHLGIIGFLLLLDWNYSVLPWNLCTAIVGAWLIWNSPAEEDSATGNSKADRTTPAREITRTLPRQTLDKSIVIFLLLLPVGFYFGLVRHGLAHVLYSNNMPLALINRSDQVEFIDCWEELKFPFPNAEKPYLDYFKLTGRPGETLHIGNQLPWLPRDRFYYHDGNQQIRKLTEREFRAMQKESPNIATVDDPRKIFELELGGAIVKRRTELNVAFAIEFAPTEFKPHYLKLLSGIPNVEQIQLDGCPIADEHLKMIPTLEKLYGIGISNTPISDAGLLSLAKHKMLQIVEHEGSAISDKAHRSFIESQTGTKIPD